MSLRTKCLCEECLAWRHMMAAWILLLTDGSHLTWPEVAGVVGRGRKGRRRSSSSTAQHFLRIIQHKEVNKEGRENLSKS
ncbi:hypothetical protein B0T10DRAFT_114881 [Thelonectria olida]|uniref:Uncharacterized protein n=1 Tax=Thelonectria olida TaxID=1576542 RepID=A0A9P9AVU6_9HYPO|nr:hypothetical protein B0T10DRAFT_114881 [Thelonectria olida]